MRFSLDQHNAADYLRNSGRIDPGERVLVRELTGGVSNMVLLVERPDRPGHDFVIKQARHQLRTAQQWLANVERAWREADVLTICTGLLDQAAPPEGTCRVCTPRLLFEDRENYLLAISAAPRPHTVWKSQLLAGQADPPIASACGWLLGTLHARSWREPSIAAAIGDRTLFNQLRVDPYYHTLAAKYPEISPAIGRLVASIDAHACALVHADFSPKNLLVFADGLMMVDFETGHFGDPAFDLGFFLSHLVLKSFHHSPRHAAYLELSQHFRRAYDDVMLSRLTTGELAALWARGIQHFAACAWARLDGKSPVEYLSEDKGKPLRDLCRRVLLSAVDDWDEVVGLCCDALQ